ncbi:MAG: winged helix-turn-helix transcriptional regulator [Candidatus Rokubacteria bacterium]|nr:winged helix-turn-helix transcriptional regulator [Candidatus Rokubacteria bacterium]
MDTEAHRDLKLLDAIANDAQVTQRSLATKLNIALGLTNLYLKRLARKGYIKLVNIQPNRIRYLITPKGIAEKTRLTYEFMQYSLQLYGQARQHLKTVLLPLAAAGHKRIAIYGTGEAAELAYLSLRELGLEPAAVFDGRGGGEFLGMPVQAIRAQDMDQYDLIIVATLDRPDALVAELIGQGVPQEKLLTLRK